MRKSTHTTCSFVSLYEQSLLAGGLLKVTFTFIGQSVGPTNRYGAGAGTLRFTVTDCLVPVVNSARSIITGLRGARTFNQYKMNQNHTQKYSV